MGTGRQKVESGLPAATLPSSIYPDAGGARPLPHWWSAAPQAGRAPATWTVPRPGTLEPQELSPPRVPASENPGAPWGVGRQPWGCGASAALRPPGAARPCSAGRALWFATDAALAAGLGSSPDSRRVSQTVGLIPCSQRFTVRAVKAPRPRVRSGVLPVGQPRWPAAASVRGSGLCHLPSLLPHSLLACSQAQAGCGERARGCRGPRGPPGDTAVAPAWVRQALT